MSKKEIESFVKAYKKGDKFDKAEMEEKVTLHQSQRLKKELKEFFRLLDDSIASGKNITAEALVQAIDLSEEELLEQLNRVDFPSLPDDVEPEITQQVSIDKPSVGKLKPPLNIEKQFFKYWSGLDDNEKGELEDRICQGASKDEREKLQSLLLWLDSQKKVSFDDIVTKSNLKKDDLLKYLEKVNWL